ncbi:MAG: hypothetical protein GQ574_24015 [Crocinitomix sp.]|nr:hypothetical protein [Crocinitomix sp.]
MYLQNKSYSLIAMAILLSLYSCYKESNYHNNSSEIFESLTVEIDSSSLSADGESSTKITYKFPAISDPDLTKLLVITSNGKFKESDNDSINVSFSKLDESKEFRFSEITLIASGDTARSIIRTEIMEYFKNETVLFREIAAKSILLTPSKFYVKNDSMDEFSLEVKLLSETGIASIGKNVIINAVPSVGVFKSQSELSNATGEVSFTYLFTDTSYAGTILFTAKTVDVDGDTLVSSAGVEVIE